MEQTASDLQAQIDQLSSALRQWRETQDHLQPMEQRLTQLTERCNDILNHWADTGQRHAQAVSAAEARLNEWNESRIKEFENTIEHERKALRQLHEEPVKQLREQAAALGETCVAAANLALRGFERAEARFAALETELQERLTQLSRDVQSAIADLRREAGGAARPLASGAAPFPLDGVMRIHDELRVEDSPVHALPAAADAAAPAVVTVAGQVEAGETRQLPEAAESLKERMESIERELSDERQEVRQTATLAERLRHDWRVGLSVAGVVVFVAAFGGFLFLRRVSGRLDEASTRVTAAERQAQQATDAAGRQIAATRADAERQIAAARETALAAQTVTNVLAAPDLVRFNLAPVDPASRTYAQLLLSRSRGVVLSASRMAAAAEGLTYQIWFIGNAAPVSGGLFTADSEGRVTFATEPPAAVPRPITGIIITAEPAGGSPAPSGTTVLSHAPPQ